MDKNIDILQNIEKNGLLPKQQFGSFVAQIQQQNSIQNQQPFINENIFTNQTTKPSFGSLTIKPKKNDLSKLVQQKQNVINGFDTDILVNSKCKKTDDKTLKLKMKIARLEEELAEHKKIVDGAYLKSDRSQYQKLLEIQNRMETEIQKLVTEYQRQQLISIVLSPFIKLFNFIRSYVVVK